MFGMRKPTAYEIRGQQAEAKVAVLATEAHLKVQLLERAAKDAEDAIGALTLAMCYSRKHDGRVFFEAQEGEREAGEIWFAALRLSNRLPADDCAFPHTSADDGRYDPFADYADEETADASKTAN